MPSLPLSLRLCIAVLAVCGLAFPSAALAAADAGTVPTTTTVTVTPSPVNEGASAKVTMTVAETVGAIVPAGTVTLRVNGSALATETLHNGVASITAATAGLASGSYSVTASYSGDSVNAASVSSADVVKVVGTTTTAVSFGASDYAIGQTAIINATVTAPSGGGTPAGTVKFSVGPTEIGSASLVGGVATLQGSTTGLAAGIYHVTATYQGSSAFQRSAGASAVTLSQPFVIAPADAALTPSGTVQFSLSPVPAGTITWYVNGVPGGDSYVGAIDANGNYTAPATTIYASKATITATVSGNGNYITPAAYAFVSVAGAVSYTNNGQVFNYAINIPDGASVVVNFGATTAYGLNTWSVAAPAGGGTVNMLVAGMLPKTTYHMQAVVSFPGGLTFADADKSLNTTGVSGESFVVTPSVLTPQPGLEMVDLFYTGAYVYDLSGNELWSYGKAGATGSSAIQPFKQLADGDFLIGMTPESAYPIDGNNIDVNTPIEIREVALSNTIVRDLDLATLQANLNSFGYVNALGDSIQLQDMHHDVTVNPTNGHWLVIANTTQVFTGLTGQSGPVTALGDVILDVDPDNNFAVDWVWSEFDHLDINRHPMNFPDWTHTNAIIYSTDDGNILVSIRHQNWIVKVNYQNGTGDGNILWHFGYQGDFTLVGGNDPVDWQYAQHEPSFTTSNTTGVFGITMMDNGNDRVLGGFACPAGGTGNCYYSRAPIFTVDETAMTATLSNGAIGPAYSDWGGNSGILANGDLEIDYCAATGGSIIQELTTGSNPQLVWQATTTGSQNYRAHRVGSFYPGVTWSTDALKFQADHAVHVVK